MAKPQKEAKRDALKINGAPGTPPRFEDTQTITTFTLS